MRASRSVQVLGSGALCVALAALPGCSISNSLSNSSDSSGSSSDSSQSSSDSSGSSSGDDSGGGSGGNAAYQADVREHTASFASSGGAPAELLASLGPVARRHGVTNWEVEPASYHAIGEGLASAGVDGQQLASFEQTLVGGDSVRIAELREGYESTR